MKRGLIVLVVVFVSQLNVFAQVNSETEGVVVKGTIYEMVNNEKVTLPFANVFIEGTDFITTTDFDGNFEIIATESVHNLKCTFRGYEAFVKEIDSKNMKALELDIIMEPVGNTAMKNKKAAAKI